MTDHSLSHPCDFALSDSTQLSVDCAKYLQLLLVATDMGRRMADLSTETVEAASGLSVQRQEQVRAHLIDSGLMHIKFMFIPGGFTISVLGLGDGR